jgi:hypothetical protein
MIFNLMLSGGEIAILAWFYSQYNRSKNSAEKAEHKQKASTHKQKRKPRR